MFIMVKESQVLVDCAVIIFLINSSANVHLPLKHTCICAAETKFVLIKVSIFLMQLKRLKLRKNNWSSESYRFDEVFTETASQKRVYEVVAKPVVEVGFQGNNDFQDYATFVEVLVSNFA